MHLIPQVVLLLLIYCLCTSNCLWGFCTCLCFDIHYLVSFIVEEKERSVCFALIVLWMACNCSVALPHDALG